MKLLFINISITIVDRKWINMDNGGFEKLRKLIERSHKFQE
jgi:hypothetical protein